METLSRMNGTAQKCILSLLLLAAFLAAFDGRTTAFAGPLEEGVNYFEGGHYRWALEKFVEAVDQSPRDPQRWWYLAESYRLLGDADAAAPAYRHVLQLAPHSPLAAAARKTLDGMGQPPVATVRIPLQRRGGVVLLPVRINGKEAGAVILDTGASFTSISVAAAAQLGIRPSGAGSVRLITANGAVQAPLAILEEVEIGGAVAQHVPAVIHELPGLPPGVVGLLGMSFLDRFQVNLDISSGAMILESGR
jgi:clan AA aspartic protease (TIGR02281 family)